MVSVLTVESESKMKNKYKYYYLISSSSNILANKTHWIIQIFSSHNVLPDGYIFIIGW